MGMVAYFIEVPANRFTSIKPEAFKPSKTDEPQFEVITSKEPWIKRQLNKLGLVKKNTDFEVRVLPKGYKYPFDHLVDEAFEQGTLPIVDVDKAWDMLHRCLNKGLQEPLRGTIAAKAIMGDAEFGSGVVMGVQTLSPKSVIKVAAALASFTDKDLKNIFPKIGEDAYSYSGDVDEDLDYVLDGLNTIRTFYNRAATNSSAVLIAIS